MAGCLKIEFQLSSPGLAVRRTASLPLAYDRATQYSRDADDKPRSRGVLDTPQEPAIGLAEGATRWRGMTTVSAAQRENAKLRVLLPRPALAGRGLGSLALGLALDTRNRDMIQAWDEDSP